MGLQHHLNVDPQEQKDMVPVRNTNMNTLEIKKAQEYKDPIPRPCWDVNKPELKPLLFYPVNDWMMNKQTPVLDPVTLNSASFTQRMVDWDRLYLRFGMYQKHWADCQILHQRTDDPFKQYKALIEKAKFPGEMSIILQMIELRMGQAGLPPFD